ncbi:MAG TPA: GTP 3',8-cyclase MoaA [Fimbriimonadaceae bacterium]|nr:GTP 3',8-cyclase MoaA [Fimbriimonadaceae bacterium]
MVLKSHDIDNPRVTPSEPLVDKFGRRHDYLRVSLTDRCNFRCLYCMPEAGVEWKERSEILTLEEIERVVALFGRLGVRKVRLTGGEPTIRKGLVDLVSRLGKIPGIEEIHLTTNGFLLADLAGPLRDAGLCGVNVSLDSLQRDRFEEITQRDALDRVLAGIDGAVASGIATKLNVVVIPGMNEDELADFVRFGARHGVQVRFIEFMPFFGNPWRPDRVMGLREIRARIEEQWRLRPLARGPHAVAQEFAVEGLPTSIGFVASMTDSFCESCNRLRITADGRFKTCLFLPTQSSLRDRMRAGADDDALARAVRADLRTKWRAHPPMDRWDRLDPLSMVEIGG